MLTARASLYCSEVPLPGARVFRSTDADSGGAGLWLDLQTRRVAHLLGSDDIVAWNGRGPCWFRPLLSLPIGHNTALSHHLY